jgi:hypothetical protein
MPATLRRVHDVFRRYLNTFVTVFLDGIWTYSQPENEHDGSPVQVLDLLRRQPKLCGKLPCADSSLIKLSSAGMS